MVRARAATKVIRSRATSTLLSRRPRSPRSRARILGLRESDRAGPAQSGARPCWTWGAAAGGLCPEKIACEGHLAWGSTSDNPTAFFEEGLSVSRTAFSESIDRAYELALAREMRNWVYFRYLVYPNNRALGERLVKTMDYVTRKQRHKRLSHLFTIDAHIPKLDVAGSNPVSRSKFFNDLRAICPYLHYLVKP